MENAETIEALKRRLAQAEAAAGEAKERLRDSDQKYRALFDNLADGLAVCDVIRDDAARVVDLVYRDLNQAFERQTGVALKDFVGRRVSETSAKADFERWLPIHSRVAATGQPETAEHFAEAAGRWFEFTVYRSGDEEHSIFVRDISEQKRNEIASRENEERQAFLLRLSDALRPIAGAADIQAATARLVGQHLSLDRAMYAEVEGEPGAETGTIRGQYVRPGPGDASAVAPFPERFAFDQFGAHTMAARYRGEPLVVSDVDTDPAFDAAERAAWAAAGVRAAIVAPMAKEGRLVAEFGVHMAKPRLWTDKDIALVEEAAERTWAAAERSRVMTELRQREADLARVQRIGQVGGLDIDVAGGLSSRRSPEYLRLHGLPLDGREEAHADWLARVHPEDRERTERALLTSLEGDASSYENEYRIVRPSDGEVRWIHARADIERDGDGKPLRLVGAHLDVTEQREMEAAVRQSEARLAATFESAPVGLAFVDPTGKAVFSNESFRRFLPPGLVQSRDPERGARWRAWDAQGKPIAPHDFPTARGLRGEATAPGQDMLYTDDDGREVWTKVSVVPTFDAEGQVTGAISVIHDIDAEKRGADALRESEERLILAIEIGEMASWDWDMKSGQVTWNDRHFLMQGYQPGEVTPSFEAWLARVHPEDRESTVALIEQARDERGVYAHDFRVLRPEGEVRWCSARGRFFYDAQGQAVRMIGVMEDVTERKRAEESLKESEERYRSLFESMDEAYAVVEVLKDETGAWADFRFLEVNPAFMGHTAIPWPVGKTATELLGTPNPRWTELYGRALDTGEPIRVEESEPALGRTFDLNIFALDPAQNRIAVLFSNITERKKAEAALRESEQRFQQFATASAAGLWMRDAATLAMEYVSPALAAIYGLEPEALIGDVKRWEKLILPEDRGTARSNIEQAQIGDSVVHEFRIRRAKDNALRWLRNTDFPLHDAQGGIQRIGGITEDVTDAKLAAERQGLLLNELQHRVRNILAMMHSIIRRSAETASGKEELRRHLEGRIGALARTQILLTRRTGAGIDLANLIFEELLAQAADNERMSVNGPPIALAPKAAEVLTLAIHELATNATKYGAFSGPAGYLRVGWDIVEEDGQLWLRLEWTEEGVVIPSTKPARSGFGMELIRKRVPYELSGRGQIELRPTGAHCRIEFPLILGDSILDTREPGTGGADGRH